MPAETSGTENAAHSLERRMGQQVLTAAFGRFALRPLPSVEIMREAARVAAEGLGARFSKVLEYEPATDTLIVRAGLGWSDGVIDHVRLPPGATSPAGYAFAMGVPTFSNDLSADHRFGVPELLRNHGIRREINVVICGDTGPPFGVLEVDDTADGQYSEDDIHFLEALANTLGLTLERDRATAERERLLNERGLLLAEVHHRVKNSLQLVHTVLTLEASGAKDASTRSLLELSAMRVMTIASVHEQLYQGQNFDEIEMGAYLVGLVDALRAGLQGLAPARSVRLEVASGTYWPPRRAQALGLILTELVTNALKYGRGEVRIRFTASDGRSGDRLEVQNESDPLHADAIRGSEGVGLRIIRALLQEHRGALTHDQRADGAHFVAEFSPSEASPT
jgi:two-component sensor histidine kinase